MRIPIRLAALTIAMLWLAPAQAQDARASATACDSHKIGARELSECLKAASDKSDRELAAIVETAVKSIEGRAGLSNAQKSRWRRLLNDAESQWLTWRDAECQDLAPFEAGMGAKGGDPRIACMIDQNARRAAELSSRYK